MGERRYCYKCMEKYDSDQHICPHCGYDDTTLHNPMYITPGTILHDRYLVGILLDYNGEGATYTGFDTSTDCKVMIREYMPINLCTRVKNKAVISVNYNNLAKYKAFMAEYTELNKSLARLRNNSNINPVLDMFAENNTTYTVFEHIDGYKMLDYLKENAGELSWEQVSKIFPPLFTTIGILHNAGIIHRAISPETVYITKKGELKLSGFCVSAVRTANAGLEYELFKGYAAPEQYSASSSSRQGSWTDVYGVSALIYRALTGCMPVDSLSRMKHDDLCEPNLLNGQISPQVSRVIMEGMNLSGRDRIQTITELVTKLFEQPAQPAKPAPSPENFPPNKPEQPVHSPHSGGNNQNGTSYNPNNNTSYNPNNNGGYGPANNQPPPYQQPVNNGGYYPEPPQPQPEHRNYYEGDDQEDDYEDYRYEKVNTVDRIKVPVIIGILLLAILMIISVVIINMVNPGGTKSSSASSSKKSSSVSDNIVTDDKETTTEGTTLPLDTEMPNLVGKFYELTQEKYADYLNFDAIYEYNNEYEADMIFEQSIKPGEQVATGTTVRIKVSKGNEDAIIPDYSGLTVSQYENKLREAGISNYTLVVSSGSAWGASNTVTSLQVDGQFVSPGGYFSNKNDSQLIVYYIPADAGYQQPYTTEPAYVEQPTTEAYVAPTTEYVYVVPEETTSAGGFEGEGGDTSSYEYDPEEGPGYEVW